MCQPLPTHPPTDYSEQDPQVKTEPLGTFLAVRPFLTCASLRAQFLMFIML